MNIPIIGRANKIDKNSKNTLLTSIVCSGPYYAESIRGSTVQKSTGYNCYSYTTINSIDQISSFEID